MHPLFTPVAPLLSAMAEHQVRAVGGAVRAVLRHDPLTNVEIDLATTATPDETERALQSAGIVTTAEGKRWGTITAHLNATPYEITSLRTDTYTPGSRYPAVTFITDWELDAQRRDFTINAISMDAEGTLFDPFDGATDLKHGIVRFIGDPLQRLSEDPLRLLRFWRFCGNYGFGGVTPELIAVFQQTAPALAGVSRQRRAQEWSKLMATPQAATVVSELQRHNLLTHLQPPES